LHLRKRRVGEWQALARRSIGVDFSCEDPLTNLPDLVSGSRDSPPTIAGIGSDGFQSRLAS